MARSVGVAYLQRVEAVRLLLEHRVAHPWLSARVRDYLDDPAVQVVNDPMGVLEISTAPESASVVLDTFFTTSSARRARRRCRRRRDEGRAGLLHRPSRSAAIELALSGRGWHSPVPTQRCSNELIVTMPEPARSRLVQASRGLDRARASRAVGAHGERFSPDVARRISERIAEHDPRAASGPSLYDEDRMTPRLVREALFSSAGRPVALREPRAARQPVPAVPRRRAWPHEIEVSGLEDPMTPRFARLLRYVAAPQQEEALLAGCRRRRPRWPATWR